VALFVALHRPHLVHHLDQRLHVFRVHVGRHAVTQVEHVTRAVAGGEQDFGDAFSEDVERGEEGDRVVIVTTSSICAFEGQIGKATYAASKGGVAALTLPAARELGRHGFRVVSLAPGVFETPMKVEARRQYDLFLLRQEPRFARELDSVALDRPRFVVIRKSAIQRITVLGPSS
jgi:NAD(P)-dependent dehydrogenase (short-subunit alcohol dehydrogenase family)